MIRIIIGIVIGALGAYALINGTGQLTQTAKGAVHSVAVNVAEATEPTTKERLGSFLSNLTGK